MSFTKNIVGTVFHKRQDYKIQTENFYMRIKVTVKKNVPKHIFVPENLIPYEKLCFSQNHSSHR